MSSDIPYYGDGERTREIIESFRAVELITPIFQNTWRKYGGVGPGNEWAGDAGFWRDLFGVVHMQGLLDKNGGNWVALEAIFTLPRGYRPRLNQIWDVAARGAGVEGTAQLRIYGVANPTGPAGQVHIGTYGGPANPVTWLSLAGLSFLAEHPQ